MNESQGFRTPKGMRLHIGIFGRRNVGKSSLLNAVTRQQVSIVSSVAGTTTDPVEKPMELLPIGPVQFIDTAGIDDTGDVGELRIEKTRKCLERTEVGILVAEGTTWGTFEEEILAGFDRNRISAIVAFNKADLARPDPALVERLTQKGRRVVTVCVSSGEGMDQLRSALVAAAPADFLEVPLIADLVPAGSCAILVIPVDKEAPKNRIILPQVQAIRDLLDNGSMSLVCQDTELAAAIASLTTPPALVVTDSQAFKAVAAVVPPTIPMTGFSVLFARFKGDLTLMVKNTLAIERLRPGARVLIAEACTHHPVEDDIGRVKIPRWLNAYKGFDLSFTSCQGHDFPEDLDSYSLVIHCGGCMHNRAEVINRQMRCSEAGVPMTNYGLTIAYSLGLFERALGPFPEALAAYREELRQTAGQKR